MAEERILVVDDKPMMVQVCAEILAEEGYLVGQACGGREALTRLDEERFDLLVVDLRMPDVDGMTVLRRARELDPEVTAVVITSYGSIENAIEALRAGARDFLRKPFDPDDLLRAVGEALAARRREQERLLLRARLPILEISQALMAKGDVEPLAGHLLEVVAQQIGAEQAALLLLDREVAELHVAAAIGLPNESVAQMPVPAGEGFARQALLGQEPLVLEAPWTASQDALSPLFTAGPGMTTACIPLRSGERAIGLLTLSRAERTSGAPFSSSELNLLSIMGSQIATTLENARLYEALRQELAERDLVEETLRRRAAELSALQATVIEITAPHDLPTLLQTIVERAALLLNALGGGLYLCDPGQQLARCVVSYNTPHDYSGTVLKYGEGAAGIVAQTGEPLIIDDYRTWSGRAGVYDEDQPFTAVLSAPMTWRGQVTGVIHVLHEMENRRFTPADLELLTLFANHAATAVENARLYDEALREITERKQAEDVLRYQATLLGSVSDAVITTDLDFTIQTWNSAAEALYGWSAEEVIGKPMVQVVPTEYRHDRREAVLAQFQAEGVWQGEAIQRHRDGRDLAVLASVTLVRDDAGQPLSVVAINRDISKQKQAEETLRESEEKLRAIYQAIPVPTYTWQAIGDDFVLTDFNDAAREVTGGQIADLVGTKASEMYQDNPEILQEFARCLAKRCTVEREMVYEFRTTGERRYLDVKYAFVPPDLILVHTEDVTERRRTEEALRESEASLNEAQAVAHVGSWRLDMPNDVLLWSDETYRIFGIPMGAPLTYSRFLECVHPEDREYVDARWTAALQGEPYDIEHRIVVGGEVKWVRERAAIAFDENGRAVRGIGTVQDITERKKAEEALRRYTEHLQILHRIDQGILAARSPEAIARAVVSHMRQLIPCRRITVVSLDLVANEAVELAVDEDTDSGLGEGTRISLEILEDVIEKLRQERAVAWGDLPSRGEMGEIVYAEGIRSYVSVPLKVRGELVGALNFGMAEPTALSQEQEGLAHQVADQLAIAIHQAELYGQVQRHAEELEQRVADRTRELSALYDIAAVASEDLDLDTSLERVLERVLAAMGSSLGAIHLLDKAEETLRLAVFRVPAGTVKPRDPVPPGSGLVGQVIARGEPLFVPDATADPRAALHPTLSEIVGPFGGTPLRAGGKAIGVLSVLRRRDQPAFAEEEVALLVTVAEQVGRIVESARLRQQAEQAALLQERQRLARELHDSVTQALYSTTLLAATGRKAAAAGDLATVNLCLAPLGETVQQALKEMRLLVYELRPLILKEAGLLSALQQRLHAVEGQANIEHRLLAEGELELSASQEQHLYRIALEALNNSLKHAAASAVTVRIQAGERAVTLEVGDNGRGFDPATAAETGGMGLATMQERVEQLGGTLAVRSAPGQGTEVTATIPSSHHRDREAVEWPKPLACSLPTIMPSCGRG